MRRQPSVKGRRRTPLPARVEERIWKEVDYFARRFNASRSWVVATALADVMGIDIDARYDTPGEKRKVRR